jgi:hypothetical protein
MKLFVGTEKTSAKNVSGSPHDDISRPGVFHTVNLFQGELLGLSDETEDHEPGDKVEPSIETD